MEYWSEGVLEYWIKKKIFFTYVLGSSITPLLQHSITSKAPGFREYMFFN